MHLGYHELRKLIETFNEQRQAARMNMNGPRPMGGPAPAAPSAPRGPVAPPPPGPSAPRMGGPPMNNGFMAPPPHVDQPMTPTGQIGLPVDPERKQTQRSRDMETRSDEKRWNCNRTQGMREAEMTIGWSFGFALVFRVPNFAC